MSNPSFDFRDVTHVIVRAGRATDMVELQAVIAPVGVTVTTREFPTALAIDARWWARAIDAAGTLYAAPSSDELVAAKHAVYNALLVIQQVALNAIKDEVQP